MCLGREQFHFTFAQNLFIDQSFSIFFPRTQRNSDICYILAERKHFKMCSVFPVGGVFVCVYVCVCVCVWGGGGIAEVLLMESYYEQMNFHSRIKEQKITRISEIGWHRVPDKRHKKAETKLLEHCMAWGISHAMNEGFLLVHNSRGSWKDNLVESHRKAADKCGYLVLWSEFNLKPMQLLQEWCHMIVFGLHKN